MEYINTRESLEKFCAALHAQDAGSFIAIDTEFVRVRTYWPRLCLVQIAGSARVGLIDTVSINNIDLAPLFAVLQDPNLIKVFHSGYQDLEIFYQLTQSIPAPIFDTQVAAMVCGFGDSVGYNSLADRICHVKLDKSCQFTNWAHRPLSSKQIDYATKDVTYLRTIYSHLNARLENSGRRGWIEEEMAKLCNPVSYTINLDNVWQRIKNSKANPRFLARLQAVAKVRELFAQEKNKVRHHVVSDQILLDIANNPPQKIEGLVKIDGLSSGVAHSRLGQALWESLTQAEALPIEQCPSIKPRPLRTPHISATMDLLQLWLNIVSRQEGVAIKLIANAETMQKLASGQREGLAVLEGWRYELFGKQALSLLEGRKGLVLSPDTQQLELVTQ